jgi:hypothetical protein
VIDRNHNLNRKFPNFGLSEQISKPKPKPKDRAYRNWNRNRNCIRFTAYACFLFGFSVTFWTETSAETVRLIKTKTETYTPTDTETEIFRSLVQTQAGAIICLGTLFHLEPIQQSCLTCAVLTKHVCQLFNFYNLAFLQLKILLVQYMIDIFLV